MAASLTVIYWRDIPAQVQGRRGRERHSVALPERFQQAIDRAAMRAGLEGADAYLDAWRREARPCGEDLAAEAAAAAAQLDADYPADRLARLVDDHGEDRRQEGI